MKILITLMTALMIGLAGGCTDPRRTGDAVSASARAAEPELETDPALLDAALDCTEFSNPDKLVVLLVHGTGTYGQEQYNWSYKPLLIERGFDVCIVTYPDRGLGDQQISAEYVVHALRRIQAESGRKVAMIGHSQGAGMPRWALRWWSSAREAVEDFVLIAGPNHGTTVADNLVTDLFTASFGLPEAVFQFQPGSNFIAAVNSEDETPGDIDYTSIYTQFDELVQPVTPVPTAALDWGLDNLKVSNILIQDLCVGRLVEHLAIGITDAAVFALALDAISEPGPADIERAGGSALCGLLPLVSEPVLPANALTELLGVVPLSLANGMPDMHLVSEEPPLKDYARPSAAFGQ